jgi:hypothetical protein
MKLSFREFVAYFEAEIPPVPPNVRPEDWNDEVYRNNWLRYNPKYLQQIQQQSQPVQQQPQGMVGARSGFAPRAAARVLTPTNPVQGQTGSGLESIPSGSRVPSYLVSQIPPGDIAPGWEVATKYYYGKDRRVYKK